MKYFFIYFSLVVILVAVSMDDAKAFDFKWERELATTLIAVDWLQTREIAKHPDKFEEIQIHKVIGKHPTTTSVHQFFAAKIAVHYLINNYLPGNKSNWYNYLTIIDTGGAVTSNYALGIRFNFK